jgi:hypothetical protein
LVICFGVADKAVGKVLVKTWVLVEGSAGQGSAVKLTWLSTGFSFFLVVEPKPAVSCWLLVALAILYKTENFIFSGVSWNFDILFAIVQLLSLLQTVFRYLIIDTL